MIQRTLNISLMMTLWAGMASAAVNPLSKPLTLTLADALHRVDQENIQLVVSQERVRRTLAVLGENRAALLPQITGSAMQKRQTMDLSAFGTSSQSNHIGPFNVFDARVKITQALFDAAAVKRLRAANDRRALSQAEYRQAKQDALALVAVYFIDARRAQQSRDVARSMFKRDKEHLKVMTARFRQGTASDVDLKQAQTAYAQSLYFWKRAIAQANARRLDLAAAVGIPADRKIVFVWDQKPFAQDLPSTREIQQSVQEHPGLQVAKEQLEASRSDLAAERAGYLPRISMFADWGPSGPDPSEFSETYTMGVQASIPVWEGGLRFYRVQEAESLVKERQAALMDVERRTEAEAFINVDYLREAIALIKAKQTELGLAEKQLAVARQQLTTGSGSELAVTDALTQLTAARDERDEATATYVISQINLAHALGQVEDLLTTHQDRSSK